MRRGYLRNFIFGAEDSLVSTVGLLSGVSFAGLASREVILSGVILILVESISMGAGVYLSEDSANDLPQAGEHDNTIADATIMLISYLLVGLIPLLPYIFSADTTTGFYYSVGFSLIALFSLGLFKGYVVGKHPIYSAIKVLVVGGLVTAIAVAVGYFIKTV
ncbi:MAG: VIT1/CCC1 transporter family protein [bacterium]|nr:VIT1/CCC1 transporter family protein [bacterium]